MHQNLINLYFRKAWQEYQKKQEGKCFSYWLRQLKLRLNKTFSKDDQWYWDILWLVNQRGYSLEQIMQEESKIDSDKEAWIKQQIESGVLKQKKIFIDLGK